MPNYSARDMLLRMANGGSVGVATSALNNIVPTYGKNNATAADLLAAEQRILGEIAADPSSWDPAVAYNAILESGVTIEDALKAGVKQSTIDAIFTSGAPLPVTAFSTPSTVTSAYESAPYAGQDMQPFYNQAQNYVSGLMADGVIRREERREAQTLATQGGYTFQDILAAGVDPSILFNVTKTPEEIAKEKQVQDSVDRFVNTQPEYVAPRSISPLTLTPAFMRPAKKHSTVSSGTAHHGPRSLISMATSQVLTTRLLLSCSRPPDQGSALPLLLSRADRVRSWTPARLTVTPKAARLRTSVNWLEIRP
jgi:hypothetical protein